MNHPLHRRLRAGLALLRASVCVLALAPAATAAVPEPDAVYYGRITLDGLPLTSGQVVSAQVGADVLASYTMGSVPGLGDAFTGEGDFYRLELPLEHEAFAGEPTTPNTARVGTEAVVYVDGGPVGVLFVGGRGGITRLDIAGSASFTLGDADSDGIVDLVDNCGGLSNATQTDTNGDGVGDACDCTLNPGPSCENPSSVFLTVGDVDNDAESTTGYGSVSYSFTITDTEITNAEYLELLAATASTDPGGLYNTDMADDPRGGILRSGVAGSFAYEVKPRMADKPVNFVSWVDAARYVNWLENGKPAGAQGALTTETGAFDLTVTDPATQAVPTPGATHSLPSEDEWFKAAYYDPALGGGAGGYTLYPTRSDLAPAVTPADALGDVMPGANQANHAAGATWNGQVGNLTTVGGSGATSASAYGTSDQGGNVSELLREIEVLDQGNGPEPVRLARGGSFMDAVDALASDTGRQVRGAPLEEDAFTGFRVVQLSGGVPDDADGDGVMDGDDNCPTVPNGPSQVGIPGVGNQDDTDFDGDGDACDTDDDGDGLLDTVETNTGVFVSESDTGTDPRNPDTDMDGFGDGFEVASGSDPLSAGETPAVPSVGGFGLGLLAGLIGALGAAHGRRRRTN